MFQLEMLIERALRPIRSLTSLNRTPIMPFNLISSPSKPFLPILVTLLAFLDLLAFFLQLAESDIELVPLVDELAHLRHQDDIC